MQISNNVRQIVQVLIVIQQQIISVLPQPIIHNHLTVKDLLRLRLLHHSRLQTRFGRLFRWTTLLLHRLVEVAEALLCLQVLVKCEQLLAKGRYQAHFAKKNLVKVLNIRLNVASRLVHTVQ